MINSEFTICSTIFRKYSEKCNVLGIFKKGKMVFSKNDGCMKRCREKHPTIKQSGSEGP